ncbi:tetratricopeptide repeat protein [Phreatobacter sp.]|uniref:tetratricopeptide repeat protein n=1 Tax=Phreatobacter sp. TaxID=1966341 RepID=UPI003F7079C5
MGVKRLAKGRLTAALLRAVLTPALVLSLALLPGTGPAEAQRSQAAAATTLKVEATASTANGFARIIFNLNQIVSSEVKISGGVLVVAFGQPIEVQQIGLLVSQLDGYVTAVRSDPDGRSLRFALSRRVTVNSMEAGERLFIDMLPDRWPGPPPGLPADVVEELTRRARDAERRARAAETARAARAVPAVGVRIGNHPTFTRILFALPEPVGVALDRSGDRLTVKIAKPFRADLRNVRDSLPNFIAEIEADTAADELLIRIMVSQQADVRAFREDNTYVVDVSMPHMRPAPQQGAMAMAPPAGATRLPGNAPVPTVPLPIMPRQQPAAATPAAPAQATPPQPPPPRAAADRPPAPVAPPQLAARPAQAEPAPSARPAVGAEPARGVSLQARRAGDTIRILVPFARDTPGAVFQRGDTLWLVFDAADPIDISGLQTGANGLFASVDATRSRDGTAIRIGLDRQGLTSTGRDGTAWIITLAETQLEPPRPVQLTRAADGGRLVASAEFGGAGQVHYLADPLAGDDLIVVTGAGPARAFLRTMEMVEFAALAGSHGLVFQPLADDLTVSVEGDRVNVSRPRGLQLSAADGRPQSVQRLVRRPRTIAFDLELWTADEQAPFRDRETDLAATAAAVHETQRTAKRLDLVRFYMARRRWPEAKSVIDAIMQQDRRVAEDGSLLGLRGVIAVMMHRPADALRDLAHPAMATAPDAAPWRAAALLMDSRAREANDTFENSQMAIGTLPASLAHALLLHAANAAIGAGALERAERLIEELQEIGIPDGGEQQFALLRGRLAEARGQDRDALASYSRAANGHHLPTRADAEQRLVATRLRLGELDRKAAISELEVMSFAWRGDDVEARTLALLSRLYAEEKRFRDAFDVMRLALAVHPRSPAVHEAQDAMTRHFEQLFLDGNADQMRPIEALSLYYDFRGMTPQGRRGDEIIRRLADRLASMELLDQAASLLQHQIDHRLQGAARTQVAARLALLHLMNRKPALALQVLQTTRLADLPEELRIQRYLLEARGHADLGRPDRGLELIADIQTPEAEMLRADILWGAGRHKEAAEQSERLVAAGRGGQPLSEAARRHLLRAAIGFALIDDALGLDRLRTRWQEAMADTPDARAFDVVTSPIAARGVEYREIARSIADRDTLEAFLKAYRERYPAETPGAGRPTSSVPGAAQRQG